ncbi:PIG-L family deacetylase [Actinomadura vinacea]|uniref:PIG-L family deacetylase n=1 Tax=Actinomadura vinacea TaxID=115336 RepID=A0ABN3JVM3_9ACTN
MLTGGTMARLAAEGHRVVLVVAASAHAPVDLDAPVPGRLRTDVLDASAHVLGCARVVLLGYEDSGPDGAALGGFSRTKVDLAAAELAELLREEDADLLTVYDPAGGYGHPDHVQVHRVGIRAAELAGTPVVLEATVDRDLLVRALRPIALLGVLPRALVHGLRAASSARTVGLENAYASRGEITHRVRVRKYSRAKRAVMAAHVRHRLCGDSVCTFTTLSWLPRSVFRLVLGTEWFVRRDLPPGTVLEHPLDMWPVPAAPPRRAETPAPPPLPPATPAPQPVSPQSVVS